MKTFTHHIAGALAVIESDGVRLALTEEELRELIAEAQKALEKSGRCQWKLDEAHGYYDTSCGEAFCFDNEFGPEKNKYRFCPSCGKEIKVKE